MINGEKLYLRELTAADVSPEYLSWINDPEINKFLETRFDTHTLNSIEDYIVRVNASPNTFFYAIVRKDTTKFIGTIKLGPINQIHGFGDMALMIGDKDSWGKGFASEAIKMLADYAFKNLNVRKILAGCAPYNIGSQKAFQKAGFHEEFKQKKQFLFGGKYTDRIVLVKFNDTLDA